MQLEDMRIFVAAVEAASFTGAAARLGLSKQFVSKRVMALEEQLGARLLVRTTRRLSVTPVGRDYFERVVQILADVADAERIVASQNAKPRGALRVTAPMSFGTMHLGPVIPEFMHRYDEVTLDIDLNDRTVDLVGEGYDMGVRIGVLSDSSLIARRIAPFDMVACASPTYLAQYGSPETPADLAHHQCLLYGHGKSVEWPFAIHGRARGVPVTGRVRVNNGEIARDAAVAGLGVTMLPTFIVSAALASGQLIKVLEPYEPPKGGVFAVYPQHRQSSAAVRAFVDFLVERFGEEATR
ncbi:LysR family transcriptional regulator [Pararobbsia silviterrae]|uniref:LysR family transcriptional regulator n=1 Tax=Pararobbsia silviterrae TaxID=1792498 RepID=UPI00197FD41A|nr:LysR family transcriptional regulator [Pararobbsia silviterrae]